MSRVKLLGIGAVVPCIFMIMAGVSLDSQGLYYDELHQAPAAFFWVGKHPTMWTKSFHDIPVLNMSYSGAIKSHLYGLYLRFVNPHFTVTSWRMLGIAFVAIGLMTFYLIVGTSVPTMALMVFAALFLTDASILLMTRHDWGPNALSMFLRLIFLGLWIRIEMEDGNVGFKYFMAGLIAGVAIFEKLSALVLLGPLLLLLIGPGKRNRWALAALGLAVGSLPLIAVNAGSYWNRGHLVSLTDVSGWRPPIHVSDIANRVSRYLELGQGTDVQAMILDGTPYSLWPRAEMMLLPLTLLAISSARYHCRSGGRLMVLANRLVIAYVAVSILLFVLPRETNFYHWVLSSPFQYAAIALAAPGFAHCVRQKSAKAAIYGAVFLAAAGGLIVNRLPNIAAVERALASGKSSPRFDPAFTRLAELAAGHAKSAAFIAADWGTGTQVYCLGDGQDDLIYEPFLKVDSGSAARAITETTNKNILYVLVTGMAPQFEESSRATVEALTTSPVWEEVAVEEEFAKLHPIHIRKFVRKT